MKEPTDNDSALDVFSQMMFNIKYVMRDKYDELMAQPDYAKFMVMEESELTPELQSELSQKIDAVDKLDPALIMPNAMSSLSDCEWAKEPRKPREPFKSSHIYNGVSLEVAESTQPWTGRFMEFDLWVAGELITERQPMIELLEQGCKIIDERLAR
jgi:hypothetical protein